MNLLPRLYLQELSKRGFRRGEEGSTNPLINIEINGENFYIRGAEIAKNIPYLGYRFFVCNCETNLSMDGVHEVKKKNLYEYKCQRKYFNIHEWIFHRKEAITEYDKERNFPALDKILKVLGSELFFPIYNMPRDCPPLVEFYQKFLIYNSAGNLKTIRSNSYATTINYYKKDFNCILRRFVLMRRYFKRWRKYIDLKAIETPYGIQTLKDQLTDGFSKETCLKYYQDLLPKETDPHKLRLCQRAINFFSA